MPPPTEHDMVAFRYAHSKDLKDLLAGDVGDAFVSKGYVATTMGDSLTDLENGGIKGNVHMQVLIPAGSKAIATDVDGENLHEYEVLLPRNTSLQLASKPEQDANGNWQVKVIAVPEGQADPKAEVALEDDPPKPASIAPARPVPVDPEFAMETGHPVIVPTTVEEPELPSLPLTPERGRTKVPMAFEQAPLDDVPKYIEDDAFHFQQKVDGIRAQLVVEPGKKPWFRSKSGGVLVNSSAAKVYQPMLDKFGTPPADSPGYVVDGEVLDGKWHVFDMVQDGEEKAPWEERMALAEEWVKTVNAAGIADIHAVPVARTREEKQALWDAVTTGGAEGVMMKRADAPYNYGGRVKHTLKAKVRSTADLVVLSKGQGAAGSVELGTHIDGKMTRVGGASILGKEKAGTINVGDVVEVGYLYASDDNKIVQPDILKVRPDKRPEDSTSEQLRFVDKTVLDAIPSSQAVAPEAPAPEAPAPEAARPRNPDLGKRIGEPAAVPGPKGSMQVYERLVGPDPNWPVDRLMWTVEKRDGAWGVFPPTDQSPAAHVAGTKKAATEWAMARANGVPDPDTEPDALHPEAPPTLPDEPAPLSEGMLPAGLSQEEVDKATYDAYMEKGMHTQTTAEHLGVSVGAVRKRIKRHSDRQQAPAPAAPEAAPPEVGDVRASTPSWKDLPAGHTAGHMPSTTGRRVRVVRDDSTGVLYTATPTGGRAPGPGRRPGGPNYDTFEPESVGAPGAPGVPVDPEFADPAPDIRKVATDYAWGIPDDCKGCIPGELAFSTNHALRTGGKLSPQEQQMVTDMDRVIADQPPIAKPMTVYRTLMTADLPDGRTLTDVLNAHAKSGEPFEELGFMSTSTNFDRANEMGGEISLTIQVPAGAQALHIDPHVDLQPGIGMLQDEWLFPRGTKFRITSTEGSGFDIEMTAEIVLDDTPATDQIPDAAEPTPPLPESPTARIDVAAPATVHELYESLTSGNVTANPPLSPRPAPVVTGDPAKANRRPYVGHTPPNATVSPLGRPEATRGGNGPLPGGYSVGDTVMMVGTGYQHTATAEVVGPADDHYAARGVGAVKVRRPDGRVVTQETARLSLPVRGMTPTVQVDPTMHGASALSLDDLGYAPVERSLMKKLIKSNRIRLDVKGSEESSSLTQEQSDAYTLKEQALGSIGRAYGWDEDTVQAGVDAVNQALGGWSTSGGVSDERNRTHDAMEHLRAGNPPETDLQRGMLMQKAYTEAVWTEKYGPDGGPEAVRVISGEYAERLQAMMAVNEAKSHTTHDAGYNNMQYVPLAQREGDWELTTYPMTSWAVPEATKGLTHNWLRGEKGALLKKQMRKEEAWLVVWGEPAFRTWGLKAPGEIIVDDRSALTPSNGLQVEFMNQEPKNQWASVQGKAEIYETWMRAVPGSSADEWAAVDMAGQMRLPGEMLGVEPNGGLRQVDAKHLEDVQKGLLVPDNGDQYDSYKRRDAENWKKSHESALAMYTALHERGWDAQTLTDIATSFNKLMDGEGHSRSLDAGFWSEYSLGDKSYKDGDYSKPTFHEYPTDEIRPKFEQEQKAARAERVRAREQMIVVLMSAGYTERQAEDLIREQIGKRFPADWVPDKSPYGTTYRKVPW